MFANFVEVSITKIFYKLHGRLFCHQRNGFTDGKEILQFGFCEVMVPLNVFWMKYGRSRTLGSFVMGTCKNTYTCLINVNEKKSVCTWFKRWAKKASTTSKTYRVTMTLYSMPQFLMNSIISSWTHCIIASPVWTMRCRRSVFFLLFENTSSFFPRGQRHNQNDRAVVGQSCARCDKELNSVP